MEIEIVDGDNGEYWFGPGTYSIGFLHEKIDWIRPGIYRGMPANKYASIGFWRIHNGVDDRTDVVAHNSGAFPLYVEIRGGRFFSSSDTNWVLIDPV